jgi:hypothetical protein
LSWPLLERSVLLMAARKDLAVRHRGLARQVIVEFAK